jgi:hypothetical protein
VSARDGYDRQARPNRVLGVEEAKKARVVLVRLEVEGAIAETAKQVCVLGLE